MISDCDDCALIKNYLKKTNKNAFLYSGIVFFFFFSENFINIT